MTNIIDFSGEKAAPYIRIALSSFMSDPPDSDYQRGYLAALVDVYKEAMSKQDDILMVCQKMVYGEN